MLKVLKTGMQIYGHAFKLGFECVLSVQNSLINMYGKCEKIVFAFAIFK